MNALLFSALIAVAASPTGEAPANALVVQQVDLHKVTDGRACTYSRPGRCSRELEVVGQADVLISVQDRAVNAPSGASQESVNDDFAFPARSQKKTHFTAETRNHILKSVPIGV